MKLTLLELVQDMLAALDAENVSGVGQTEEAGMCVQLANRSYEQMMMGKRWRHLRGYHVLSTTAIFNEMTTPSGTVAVDPANVYYNDQNLDYLSPEDFLAMTIKRNTAESNIALYNGIKVYTDRDPKYFTSDDDETLRFDAIPDIINGLQSADTMVLAFVAPTSRLTADGEYFDMPAQMFPALNSLCIAKALGELKGDTQQGNVEMRNYRSMAARLGRNARLVDRLDDTRKWIIPRRSLGTATGNISIA